MRAMGENPTEDDVLNLMMEADLDGRLGMLNMVLLSLLLML